MSDFGYTELVEDVLAQPYQVNIASFDTPGRRLDRHVLVLIGSPVAEAQLDLKRVPFWASAGADAYDCQIQYVRFKRGGQQQSSAPRGVNDEVTNYVRPARAIDIDID
jgi:hypothetical protein